MKHRILPALFAVLALAGCKREPAQLAGVIPRDKFVAANVAVRSLPDSAPQAQRDAALRKAGVTNRQLRAWVTAYARQPETLAAAWEEIAFKVDSLSGTRPVPQTPSGPPTSTPPTAAAGSPLPPPRGDTILTITPGADSMLARRRMRRPPPPPRPGLEAMERVQ